MLPRLESLRRLPLGLRRAARPVDAVVAVNGVCNARCRMCSIWETQHAPLLPIQALEALPRSLRDLNLTGGEPFLRDDLAELGAAARQRLPRARIVVSTNGFLTERVLRVAAAWQQANLRIGIAVSVDGVGPMHDRVRGVPGAFRRVMGTLRGLRALGYQPRKIAFTVTRDNTAHLSAVHRLATRMGSQFSCTLAQDSPHYFRIEGQSDHRAEAPLLAAQVARVARAELRGWSPRRWARAWYLCLLLQTARSGERPLPCRAGRDFFFADWRGGLYPCNILPIPLGTLGGRAPAGELLATAARDGRLREVDTCRRCWMVCTARTAMRRAWPQAARWILAAQARRLTGAALPLEPRRAASH